MPNSLAMNLGCPIASPFATHRTPPFRIMCTAAIPGNVRHAVGNEPCPFASGSGANLQVCEIRWVLLCEMEIGSGYAARAACQISGIVAVSPPSLLM